MSLIPLARLRSSSYGISLLLSMSVLILGFLGTALLSRHLKAMAHREAHRLVTEDYTSELAQKRIDIENRFDRVYDAIRMMANLPSVRKLDRLGKDLSDDSRQTIQAIYDTLASDIDVSEIYIVPAGMDADKLDSATVTSEQPAVEFDNRIKGHHRNAGGEKLEEIEIYEYRAMKSQCEYFKSHFPSLKSIKGDLSPAVTSPELITCDNSEFSASMLAQHDNSTRMGIVYSVPTYGISGEFKGMISAVIRSRVIKRWMDAPRFTLSNPSLRWSTAQTEGTSPPHKLEFQASQPCAITDGVPWSLTLAIPDTTFFSQPDFTVAASTSRTLWPTALISIGALTAMVLSLTTSRARAIRLAAKMTAVSEIEKHSAETARSQLQLLLDSSGEGIYGVDNNGRCTFINPAAARILGYDVEDLIGKPMHDAIHCKHADGSAHAANDCPIYRSFKVGDSCRIVDDVFWTQQNVPVPVEYSAFPIKQDNQILGSVISFSDITARRAAETELVQAKERAETASRAKGDFLARMSHEIRTPLNCIFGMLDLLSASELSSTQTRYSALAKEAGEALMQVINDVLDFAKLEAEKVELEHIQFDVRKLCNNLLEVLKPAADKKRLLFKTMINSDVPTSVVGDPGRTRQILSNLISNALKFTSQGSILVRITTDSSRTLQPRIRISVEDTGIGVPADRMDRLFKSFSQVDTSITRRYGGTGLGLAICDKLTHLMGGDIGVESHVGKGTHFWFAIPFEMPTKNNSEAPIEPVPLRDERSKAAGLHILIAEDNDMNQFVVSEILRRAGCTSEIVGDGQLAVDAVMRTHFDLVLMDCQMPTMDGIKAATLIREHEKAANLCPIPIIALTAEAIQGDRERFLAAGMNDYVSKPIDSEKLFHAIASAVAPSSPEIDASGSPINTEELLRSCGHDNELVTHLLEQFVIGISHDYVALEHFISTGEAEYAVRLAEQIHTAAESVNASRLAELAGEIERAGAEADRAFIIDHLPKLTEEVKRCRDFVPAAIQHLAVLVTENNN